MDKQKLDEERNMRTNSTEMDSTTQVLIIVFIILLIGAFMVYKFW